MEKTLVDVDVATITDISVLQNILKKVYNGKSPWSITVLWLELSRKRNSIYLKALDAGEVIGFIGVRLENNDAHITNVAVIPEYQYQGIGTMLIEEVCSFAAANGCVSLSLEVKKSNQSAIGVYKKFGFTVKGIKPEYYKENNEDAIDMEYLIEAFAVDK